MSLLRALIIKHTGGSFTLLVSDMITGYLSYSGPGPTRAYRDTEGALGSQCPEVVEKVSRITCCLLLGMTNCELSTPLLYTPSRYPTKTLLASLIYLMRPQVRYWAARTWWGDTLLNNNQMSNAQVCQSISRLEWLNPLTESQG